MRKSFTIAKVAMGLLGLIGYVSSANAQQVAELDTPITVTAGSYATFTPSSGGTLVASFEGQGLFSLFGTPEFLFTGYNGEDGTGVVNGSVLEENGGYATKMSWSVTASTKYYLVTTLMTGDQTFILTMDGAGGGDSGNTGGLSALQLNYTYSNISQSNPVEGYFTADSNGVLKATQLGSSDTHFYQDVNHTQLMPCDGVTPNSPYVLTYSLMSGQTIYYYAPDPDYPAYDSITSVTFSWEGSTGGTPVITENTPFSSYNEVMTYTPAEDGLLTITVDTYAHMNWWSPAGSGLLFTDYGHNNRVLLNLAVDAIPCVFTTPVVGGTTYYFFNDHSDTANSKFTFSLSEMPTPSLFLTEPEPGYAIDYEGDYGNGTLLTFDPAGVTFDAASVTYTVSGKSQTDYLINDGVGGENTGWDFVGQKYKFPGVSRAYGMADKGTSITLTLEGASYQGVPVTETVYSNSEFVSVNNGTVKVSWQKPAEGITYTSSNWPTTIYSTPTQGNPNQIATITFNMALSSTAIPSVSCVFGSQTYGAGSSGDNPDPGMDIPANHVVVNGNTLTVDLNDIDFGALRAQQPNKSYSKITFFIGNIFSHDGQKFLNENPGWRQVLDYSAEEAPAPTYMADPNLEYDSQMENLVLYWDEAIYPLIDGQDITASIIGPSGSRSVELSFTTYNPNYEDVPGVMADDPAGNYNALVCLLGDVIDTMGAGEYSITIGSIVKNAQGNPNKDYTGKFTVAAPLEVITEYQFNYTPMEKALVVTWDSPISEYNEYDADVIIASLDWEVEKRLSVGNGVTLSGNSINISLEGLDLVEGTTYQVIIPENYVYIGEDKDATNDSITEEFIYESGVIEYPFAYTLNPAPGSTVSDLQGITLSFDEEVVNFFENNRMPAVVLENTTTGAEYVCSEPDRNTNATVKCQYVFNFTTPDDEYVANINEPGEYLLTIKAMYYGDYMDYPSITANYKVEATTEPDPSVMPAAAIMFEPDPAAPALFIYWNEEIEAVADKLTGTLVTPNEEEVEVTFAISTYLPGVEEGTVPAYNDNALILPMAEYVAEYGSGMYQISVPAGIVQGVTSGKLNAAVVEDSFFVAAEPTVSEAEPVINYDAEADCIYIIWDDMEVSEYNPNGGYIHILGSDESDFEDARLEVGDGVAINGDMVIVDLEGLGLIEGEEYTLSIAAYYFYLGENNEANAAIDYKFVYGGDSTGVSYLEAEAAQGGIYNLNGVKINSDVKNLQKGVYIINGKKVFINK